MFVCLAFVKFNRLAVFLSIVSSAFRALARLCSNQDSASVLFIFLCFYNVLKRFIDIIKTFSIDHLLHLTNRTFSTAVEMPRLSIPGLNLWGGEQVPVLTGAFSAGCHISDIEDGGRQAREQTTAEREAGPVV